MSAGNPLVLSGSLKADLPDVTQYGAVDVGVEGRGRSATPSQGSSRSRSLSLGRSSRSDQHSNEDEEAGFDVWSESDIEAQRISNNYIVSSLI